MPYGKNEWVKFGSTETIRDDLNPNFVKKFVVEYCFEQKQKLKFEIVDIDCKSSDLRKHDYLGCAEFTLAEIVASHKAVERPLKDCPKSTKATILVSAEELSSCKEEVTLEFSGENLDKMDTFGQSDPFLLFYRSNEDHTYTAVHKTEVIKKTLNPKWKPFTIPVRALCNGDDERALKVECYDWDRDGSHDFIGEFYTTMKDLRAGPKSSQNVYECINKTKEKKKKGYKNSGTIKLVSCKVKQYYTFVDHIQGGTKINCTIAVDFTRSNGDITSPSSLHYTKGNQPSMYEQALRAVGEILQDYDSDKEFPAYGFGAKIPPDGKMSHEFFMNQHPTNPYCRGIDGVVEAYHATLNAVQPGGPTQFSPIIRRVAEEARIGTDGKNYHILLILTDDNISDMQQTVDVIVRASTLPLSIIIVGIGKTDFTGMRVLDGDEEILKSRGKKCDRDIVQFVQLRDFMKDGQPCESRAALAREVLAEVPLQFLSYMEKHGLKPRQKPAK